MNKMTKGFISLGYFLLAILASIAGDLSMVMLACTASFLLVRWF